MLGGHPFMDYGLACSYDAEQYANLLLLDLREPLSMSFDRLMAFAE